MCSDKRREGIVAGAFVSTVTSVKYLLLSRGYRESERHCDAPPLRIL